jgi:membrane protein involved in colicin uptake
MQSFAQFLPYVLILACGLLGSNLIAQPADDKFQANDLRIEEARSKKIDEQRRQAAIRRKKQAEQAARDAKINATQAAIRRKKQAEQAARDAKISAAYEATRKAEAAAEKAKLRAACSQTYMKTIDKKLADLTVSESQHVQACQALGMYPLR